MIVVDYQFMVNKNSKRSLNDCLKDLPNFDYAKQKRNFKLNMFHIKQAFTEVIDISDS